jgi:hypothetical protein
MHTHLLKAEYHLFGELIDIAFLKNTPPRWQVIKHSPGLPKKGVILGKCTFDLGCICSLYSKNIFENVK